MGEVLGNRVCLFGAGGHGRSVAGQMAGRGLRHICFADGTLAVGTLVDGFAVRHTRVDDIAQSEGVIITLGSNALRRRIQARAVHLGLALTRFVADPENCFAASVGLGTVVLAGAVVNAGAQVGDGVIVNTRAVVEHGCTIGDYCHISPGAVVAGDAQLGAGVWIGANAVVLQGRSICDDVVLGAGAVATRDIDRPGTYVGQPARLVKTSADAPDSKDDRT